MHKYERKKVVGEELQPWGGRETVFKYQVKVAHSTFKSSSYTTNAWGSIADYGAGRHDCAGIGAMVVDELLSAAADPDEFIARKGEKVVKAAEKFRFEELQQAVDAARERGLL